MGPRFTARRRSTYPTKLASLLKLVFAVYVVSSVVYSARHFYLAFRPLPSERAAASPDGSEDLLVRLNDRQRAVDRRHLSEAKSTNWASQRLFWSNVEGSVTPMAADYIVGKVFGGLKPSTILPYYSKADPPPQFEDITVTTLVTEDRFPVLERLIYHYQGPVSVCIHVNDDARKPEVLQKLHSLLLQPMVRRYADVHLVVDNHDRQFNLWRNVARFFARTEFVLVLDVDFFLCTDIRQSVLRNPEHLRLIREQGAALVIPAYEFLNTTEGLDARTFPRTKGDMLPLYRSRRLAMFHNSWVRGHNSTDYERWANAEEAYEVVTYQFNYEPYVVMKKEGVAWCDERFIGYGSNKAACLFELYLSGTNFWVLPDDFLIHQTHQYPEQTRKQERIYNKKLYQNFREEACFKYARMLMAQDEWNTSRARNVKSECARIPGFSRAMEKLA